MKRYDIFISYRRTSFDTANLIATKLTMSGYSVFLDIETLRSGMFNQKLYEAIEECNDFILILPPNALDRCVNEEDWVRKEVEHALKLKKNIIPIMLSGFVWPSKNSLPDSISELPNYNGITASEPNVFSENLERLKNNFLQSKPRTNKHRVGIIILSITTILLSLTTFIILIGLPKTNNQDMEVDDSISQSDIEFNDNQKAAEHGDVEAQIIIADHYYNKEKYTEARLWYHRAAEQGNTPAKYMLGIIYMEGKGGEKDIDKAIKWFNEAGKQGDIAAISKLAVFYYKNHEYAKAIKWLEIGADMGDAWAQNYLGCMYSSGEGIVENDEIAAKLFHKAASQGFVDGIFNLALYYEAKEEYEEAIKWFQRGAEKGDAGSQYNLGNMYHKGIGIEQDIDIAIQWLQKAAEQGMLDAAFNLALCYDDKKEYHESVKWLRIAAEQGDATAQYNLACKYQKGEGVEKNTATAIQWYRKSAEQGFSDAQYNLGCNYYKGIGIDKNYIEAAKWFKKAADQGDELAQYNLGIIYYYGDGVEKNNEEAARWFKKAAEQGDKQAMEFLEKLNNN